MPRCPLWEPATQTVFGEGPAKARIMLVGEVPGDEEDLSGHPFVGPSGQLLDRALDELGLDREAMYVTNAVKHFKFVRGLGLMKSRGQWQALDNGARVLATVHPSWVLRQRGSQARQIGLEVGKRRRARLLEPAS